ncbi:flavonoid 3-O-glucosyltransferase-like [Ziziphus jujuba]|nr:flavonoid 3-O-glucosyltransferase-like [Ziziphus jujuba]
MPEGVISGDLDSCYATMLLRMGRNLPKAKAVAINSFQDIHLKLVGELKDRFQSFLNIGPFSLKCPPTWTSDEHRCLEWLDQHEYASVAYISFGRIATPPPHELIALAEALEECKVPFLWSFRGNVDEKLPKGLIKRVGSRGKIVPWTVQLLVLAHPSVGVFVTHGGWNSILESIIAGVPMICRPFFGDQKINMRTLEKVWGFGIGLQGGVFTKNGAKEALELTLLRKEGWEMRDKIRGLKENAYQSVGADGSSTEDFNTLIDIITK